MGLLLHSLELRKQVFVGIVDFGLGASPGALLAMAVDQVAKNGVVDGQSVEGIQLLDQLQAHGAAHPTFPKSSDPYMQNCSRQGVQKVWPQWMRMRGTRSVMSQGCRHSSQLWQLTSERAKARISAEGQLGACSACWKKQVVGFTNFFMPCLIFKPCVYNPVHRHIVIVLQAIMPSVPSVLLHCYLVLCPLLVLLCLPQPSPNYFHSYLLLCSTPQGQLLLCNLIVCLCVLCYKLMVKMFYLEVQEIEKMMMIERLWYRIGEVCVLVVLGEGVGVEGFGCCGVLAMLALAHMMLNARTVYVTSANLHASMGVNLRLLTHFIITIFMDYCLLLYCDSKLTQSHPTLQTTLLICYILRIVLTLPQPVLIFAMHLYQLYTQDLVPNLHINMVRAKFVTTVVRVVVQAGMLVLLGWQHRLEGVMMVLGVGLVEVVLECRGVARKYWRIVGVLARVQGLPELGEAQLADLHDRTCTVCFHELVGQAVQLPCRHVFHRECLHQWIIQNENHTCPKCNKQFQVLLKDQHTRPQQPQQQHQQQIGSRTNAQLQVEASEEDHIQIVQIGKNYLAKLSSTGTQLCRKADKIGSIPYGLPSEAVYDRKHRHMSRRNSIIGLNEKLIRFMKMEPARQILFLPQF